MGNNYRKFKRSTRKQVVFSVLVNFMFVFFVAGFLMYVLSLVF